MKRLLIVCLLSSPAYGITLKEAYNSRVASAAKALISGYMAGCSGVIGCSALKQLWNQQHGFSRKLIQNDLYYVTEAGGMFYTTDYLVRYALYHARHAIDGTK